MSIQWGIGIEHELLSYQDGDHQLGTTILENLHEETYGLNSYIEKFIIPTSYYPTYLFYNLTHRRYTVTPQDWLPRLQTKLQVKMYCCWSLPLIM